jgi:hypothetical protein
METHHFLNVYVADDIALKTETPPVKVPLRF